MKVSDKDKAESLALAEWYASCPRRWRRKLGADFGMWAHLFIWVGMFD